MLPSYRVLKLGLAVLAAAGLFALTTVSPLAQSNQLPSPTSHVNDLAGVLDPQIKSRLESLLANLKDKTKIELYVAMIDTTDGEAIDVYSQRLATQWNIASKTSRTKSLLMVVSAASKTSFTQISRPVQTQLPDGVLGEMSYRMHGPLSDGRFSEAIDGGVRVFVNALAEKIGFNAADLEPSAASAAVDKPATPTDSSQTVLISANTPEKTTRPRVVRETARAQDPQPTPEATPSESPTPEATTAETPKTDAPKTEPTPAEAPKTEAPATEEPKTEIAKPPKRNLTAKGTTAVTKKSTQPKAASAAQPVEPEDEAETVSLTLVLPVDQRTVKLKEFLDTHPDSKERPRAIEYLVSAHAQLGDQKLQNGDIAGGVEHLLRAIDEAGNTTSDQLFSGVISQIPMNLYLRGERDAAFKAAQNVANKFGSDPKRLLAMGGFFLAVERGEAAISVADSAIKLAPDMAEAHRTRAIGLHLSLRLDEAAEEYKKTLELDPQSKVSRVSLADLYRASGKAEQALALYNEELASDPKDRAARAGKVISLLELSRTDEANTELDAALKDDPRNLPLLAGTGYWFAAHGNNKRAFEMASQAVTVESRYTWSQIALAHAYLSSKQPFDAERAMRYAKQYGKFPTLNYELATVLTSMGLYQEAADVLRESFQFKDGQIQTRLAGHVAASESSFIELLAPERRAGIFQANSPDTPENAKQLKALLALNTAITPADGEKIDEAAAVAAAQDFAAGIDSMRAFRQMYAANRLLRNDVGVSTALELVAAAKKASDDALNHPYLTIAVQADEFRDMRARSITAGTVPDIAEGPRNVLSSILKGRLEDLQGWGLFNQEKYPEAIEHLKQAVQILPEGTPAWRGALWHLGAVNEQTGKKELALDYYIKSYAGGDPDSVRRSVIEQLYRKINGSLDGLEQKLTGAPADVATAQPAPAQPAPAATDTPTPTETPKPEPSSSAPAETTKPEAAPPDTIAKPDASPAQAQPSDSQSQTKPADPPSEESLRAASSRIRSTIRITGRIVDENKAPLANATVVLISPSGSVIAATTNSEGMYSFTVAPSQKTYRVIPSKEGFNFAPLDKTLAALLEDQKGVDFVGSKQ